MTTTVLAYIPSPSQGVWYLGPFPIRAYALFIIVGIIAALIIGDRRWAARGGERGVIYDIALWAVPFGLIGGRLYHVMTDWDKYFGEGDAGVVGALRIWDGGLGIWGAVALGGVGAWIGCRRAGIPLPAFGDAVAPGIILAQAIGRLGNYFNQELYGRPTTVPWGLEIYERRNANGAVSPDLASGVSTGQLDSIVHPTFLYELLWNVLIFALLIWADRKFRLGHGRLFALYVAGYCLGRFWIELLRSDQATLIADIRVNSFTSTFVFIGAVVYIMVAPRGREDPSELRGHADDEDERAIPVASTATAGGAPAAATVSAEDLGADVAGVPAETVEEAEEFAAKGDKTVPDDAGETTETAVGGLGSVDGEEAVAAQESAVEAHEAAVEGAADAEEAAAELAAEADEASVEESVEAPVAAQESAVEAHEAAVESVADAEEAAAELAAEADEASVEESDEAPADEQDVSTEEAVGGVGAVEGEEIAEAEGAAPEAHEAAVEGAVDAEEAVAEVAAEADEASVEESDEAPVAAVGGVGSVEGEEAVAAEESAAEAHEAAVERAVEAEEAAAEVTADADEASVEESDEKPADEEGESSEAETADQSEESADAEEAEQSEESADAKVADAQEAEPEVKSAAEPAAVDAKKVDVVAELLAPTDTRGSATGGETGGRVRRWLRDRRGR